MQKNNNNKLVINKMKRQNVHKNLIIFFFTYIYRWSFYFLYKFYIAIVPEKKVIIIDPIKEYIKNNKDKLLRNTDNSNININITEVFYNKKELDSILIKQDNELEKMWKSRILIENTPRGNIIMYYDVYKNGFAYYSDTNGIPYNILNAVAMKYTTTYHCMDFFMDNEHVKESPLIKLYLESDKDNTEKKDKLPSQKLDNSVFAKLKNYQTDNNTDYLNEVKTNEKEYNSNIFINLDKINNFNFLQKPPKKNRLNGFHSTLLEGVTSESTLQHQVINYRNYKQMKLGQF